MLGNASCTTPKALEGKVDIGSRASSAVSAKASRTAVQKKSGDLRWSRSLLVDPSPTPSTSVTGAVRKRALRVAAMASTSSSSEVMMVAAAPQQGTAMSLASNQGVRRLSRRNGFPALIPAG